MRVSRLALLVPIFEVNSIVRVQTRSKPAKCTNSSGGRCMSDYPVQNLRSSGANLNIVVNVELIRTKPNDRYR